MLVLSPTRELASQIEASIVSYGRNLRLRSTLVFGGVPIGRQIRACAQGVDIVVATPGRLLDVLSQRALTLAEVEVFVLDEADRMLDLGFMRDIQKIVADAAQAAPEPVLLGHHAEGDRPAGRCAAERAGRSDGRAGVGHGGADRARADPCSEPRQAGHAAPPARRSAISRALVFTRTKHGADRVVKHLNAAGIKADAIHGNKSQGQRERALGAFRAGQSRLLVATDIAARGIDVDGVTHVINFELPNIPETYVHRIGRTARAGAEGRPSRSSARTNAPSCATSSA